MTSADIAIRSATLADAAQLAEFARVSFRATYSPTHDPERMRVHLATVLSDASFAAALETDDFLVAVSSGTIVAFAQLRRAAVPVRSEPVEDRLLKAADCESVATPFDRLRANGVVEAADCGSEEAPFDRPVLSPVEGLRANGEIELRRFYVDRTLHGQGVAQRMFDAAVDRARAMAGELLWLGVFPGNARAIAFYKRQGCVEIGRVTYNFVDLTEDDLALALKLYPESA